MKLDEFHQNASAPPYPREEQELDYSPGIINCLIRAVVGTSVATGDSWSANVEGRYRALSVHGELHGGPERGLFGEVLGRWGSY